MSTLTTVIQKFLALLPKPGEPAESLQSCLNSLSSKDPPTPGQ